MSDFAAGFASGAGQVIPGAIQERERRELQKQQLDDEKKFREDQLKFQREELESRKGQLAALTSYYNAMTGRVTTETGQLEDPVSKRLRELELAMKELGLRGATATTKVAEGTVDAQIEDIKARSEASKQAAEDLKKRGKWTDTLERQKWLSGNVQILGGLASIKNDAARMKLAEGAQSFQEEMGRADSALRKAVADRSAEDLTPTEQGILGNIIADVKASGNELSLEDYGMMVQDIKKQTRRGRVPVFSTEGAESGSTGAVPMDRSMGGYGRPATGRIRGLQGDVNVLKDASEIFGKKAQALTPDEAKVFADPANDFARTLWNRQKHLVIPNPMGGYTTVRVDAAKYGDAIATLQKAYGLIENRDMASPEQVQRMIGVVQNTYKREPYLPSWLGVTQGPKF